ncbi:TPA: hypothetical protein ACH3X1_002420 [Trebouxia sp. C0004]
MAIQYHYILTTDAAEAALEAANEATGEGRFASWRGAHEGHRQQAKVPEVADQQAASTQAWDCDPLNPEGLIAKAFVAQYGQQTNDAAVLEEHGLAAGHGTGTEA